MKTRSLIALALAFIALAAATVLLLRGGTEDDLGSADDPLGVASYTSGATSKVSMEREGADPVVLQKVDGRWKIGAKTANAEQVEAFFVQLDKLERVTLVSKNPENHERLGATAKAGTTVLLTRDGSKLTLVVGNGADTAGSLYVKRDGDDEVWQATAPDLLAQLAQDAKAWQTAPAKDGAVAAAAPAGPPQVSAPPSQ